MPTPVGWWAFPGGKTAGLVPYPFRAEAPFRTTPLESIAYLVIYLALHRYSRLFVSIRGFSSSLNAGRRRVLN
jgi:hypothetical protein